MRPGQIFISYRRDDSAGFARAIYNALAQDFGAERVFIDVDDIDPGKPFSEVIQRAVGESAVALVLIGKRWRGECEDGAPRLHEAGDFVRREVAAALTQGVRVIPVLLDGATMPGEAQLPEDLRPLAGCNALEVDHSRFAADMARLAAAVRDASGTAAAAPPRRRPAALAGLTGALLVIGALAIWAWRAPTLVESVPVAEQPAARPAINGDWRADVTYDWPNANYVERFRFAGEGADLHGSASFLGVARGMVETRVEPAGLSFVTRTGEVVGSAGTQQTVHRYRGRLAGDEIRFVMQTEGGGSVHVPVEFVARRMPTPASQAAR